MFVARFVLVVASLLLRVVCYLVFGCLCLGIEFWCLCCVVCCLLLVVCCLLWVVCCVLLVVWVSLCRCVAC